MKVLITEQLSDEQMGRIRSVSSDFKLVAARTREDQLMEIADADAILGGFNRDSFSKAKKLKWVQVLSAGVDGMLFKEFVESDIILTSAKGYVGPHLSDQAMALLLSLTRGIAKAVREKRWDNRMAIRHASWELTDKTIGIVGFGGTGRDVAKRAAAFGSRIIAVDPEEVEKPDYVEAVWKMDQFYHLLSESDVVIICAPLTQETRGRFNLEAFNHMRRHAILINVTRGKIVDGPSLIQALQQRLIGGAGLDVTPEEPLPSDNPLWNMENVVITPHVAGGSPLRLDRGINLFCENLGRFIADQPLVSVIDKRKGY